jgi:hypothetical protein
MRAFVAIPLAYLVAVAATPLVFYIICLFAPIPMPRGRLLTPWFQSYSLDVVLALVSALPGFAITRGLLWRMGARSAIAFLVAGVGTGFLAAIILTWPGYLYVLTRFHLALTASVTGGISSMIYWWVEQALMMRGRRLINAPQQ